MLFKQNKYVMKISVLSVFPDLYQQFLQTSLIKRAQEKDKISFEVCAFSSFCESKERIDGPAAGHGAGMVIRPEVLERAVNRQEAKYGKAYRIFLTPQGKKLDQRLAKKIAQHMIAQNHTMFVAGRYEGIDERAQEAYCDLEVSIGDYVLMGGDLPAMVLLEAVLRYVPGVVAKDDSVEQDSFSGPFVDHPTYTTPPRVWNDRAIPEVLLSGNHAAMEQWRLEKAAEKSVYGHFAWVREHCQTEQEIDLVKKYIPAHYAVLMHDQVMVNGAVGTSSVTSIDIHDIARSARTYGLQEYGIVTPLQDQKKIVETILGFWHTAGIAYNYNRADAVGKVSVHDSLNAFIVHVKHKEEQEPVIIATSAKRCEGIPFISYHDQAVVWGLKRPVIFIFGTAQGLSHELIERCDYLLGPIEGFSDFNHLSVRSAAAIIFDRWLGRNFASQ